MMNDKASPTLPGMPNADAVAAVELSDTDPASIVQATAEKLVADAACVSTPGFTDAQIAIVNEVAAAGVTALRRIVERPDDADAIMATLLTTGQGLDGIQQVMRHAPDATSGVEAVFGATRLRVHARAEGGGIEHAEARIDDTVVMMGEMPEAGEAHVHVDVPDAEATFAKAVEAGGTIVQELRRSSDGEHRGGVADGNGRVWWISTQDEYGDGSGALA